jgi:hypothetical protein
MQMVDLTPDSIAAVRRVQHLLDLGLAFDGDGINPFLPDP